MTRRLPHGEPTRGKSRCGALVSIAPICATLSQGRVPRCGGRSFVPNRQTCEGSDRVQSAIHCRPRRSLGNGATVPRAQRLLPQPPPSMRWRGRAVENVETGVSLEAPARIELSCFQSQRRTRKDCRTPMARGDHLIAEYPYYTHHGIDLGDGTVMEYGGKGGDRMSIRRVHRHAFFGRGPVRVRNYPRELLLSPEETVRRAWARLREQRYDLFNNNCEHFASWCKTGLHWSPQADGLKQALVGTALVGIALAIAGGDEASGRRGSRR